MYSNQPISFFAKTNARLPHHQFGIKNDDRFSHFYVIGRTGAGNRIEPHHELLKKRQGKETKKIFKLIHDKELPGNELEKRAV